MGGHRLLPGLFILVVLVLVLVALITLRDDAARATPPAEPTLLPENVELLQTADPSTDPAHVASFDQWQNRTLPLNLGLTGDTVWLRVTFEGPDEASRQLRVLHLDNASLNGADLWLYEEGESMAQVHYRTGQRYPLPSARSRKAPLPSRWSYSRRPPTGPICGLRATPTCASRSR